MITTPIIPTTVTTNEAFAPDGPLRALRPDDRTGFASVLDRVAWSKDARTTARETAQEFVAMTLVQPILTAARESNAAAPPFAPGDAERRFGFLLDQRYANEIVRAQNFPLVDAVTRQLLRHAGIEEDEFDDGAAEDGAGTDGEHDVEVERDG